MAALDADIEFVKKELEKMNKLRLDRMQSLVDCTADFTNRIMVQPSKVQELSEYLSIPY